MFEVILASRAGDYPYALRSVDFFPGHRADLAPALPGENQCADITAEGPIQSAGMNPDLPQFVVGKPTRPLRGLGGFLDFRYWVRAAKAAPNGR